MYMDLYGACSETGYNIQPTAKSPLGVKRSEETKKKISIASRGRRFTAEVRVKMSESQKKSYEENPDRKVKQAEGSRGREVSSETRRKISASKQGKKRAPFSEEAKRNMSESRRGVKHSLETKAKMAEARKEYWKRKKEVDDNSNKVVQQEVLND
jgi:hypothetical protein